MFAHHFECRGIKIENIFIFNNPAILEEIKFKHFFWMRNIDMKIYMSIVIRLDLDTYVYGEVAEVRCRGQPCNNMAYGFTQVFRV